MSSSGSEASKPGVGRRKFLAGAISILVLLVGIGVFLRPRPPEPEQLSPPRPPTTACLNQVKIQHVFATLAVGALAEFGRIDPELYEVSPEGVIGIREQATARSAASSPKEEDRPPTLISTIARVNQDEGLRLAFISAHTQALRACTDEKDVSHCPPKVYDIDVKRTLLGEFPDGAIYSWHVNGTPPLEAAWEDGFLTQYSYRTGGTCDYLPALVLTRNGHVDGDPKSKIQALEPAAKRTEVHASTTGQGQASTEFGDGIITDGQAYITLWCSSSGSACGDCWLSSVDQGDLYRAGSRWCCGSLCQ